MTCYLLSVRLKTKDFVRDNINYKGVPTDAPKMSLYVFPSKANVNKQELPISANNVSWKQFIQLISYASGITRLQPNIVCSLNLARIANLLGTVFWRVYKLVIISNNHTYYYKF